MWIPVSAREIRKAEFKQELVNLLDLVIPKGAISVCLIADSDKICKVSKVLTPETANKEFTVKIADIQKRGFNVVFNEAWRRAEVEVDGESW